MRNLRLLVGGSLAVLLTSYAAAQELTPGKYSGTYTVQGFQVRLVLDIASVDGGNVTGRGERRVTAQGGERFQGGCIGAFPLTGKVKGDGVALWAAEKFGPGGDCQFLVRGRVSGDKILGKIGQEDVELSK